MNEKLLTTVEAAERLVISKRRVIKLIEDKRLTATRYGTIFLIKESDLAAVMVRKNGRPKKEKPDAPETVKPDAPDVPDAPEPKTLLSVEAAAAFLKCSEKEIKRMKRNGLPTEKGKINENDLTVVNRRLFAR